MLGLAEILLASGLVMGGHELNHGFEADRQNVPFESGVIWDASTDDKEKLARIANAGFEGQEIISGAVSDTKIAKSVRLVSALNKLGYALLPGGIQGSTGDVKMIEQNKGKKARQMAQAALSISAIDDILTAFGKKKSDRGFRFGQSSTGTPMLAFGGLF